MSLGIITAIVYGVITLVGGIIGYNKANSKASLISGGVSGVLLIAAGILQIVGQDWGLVLATLIAGVLVIVFIARLVKTKKFMPAGMMILSGLTALGLFLYQLTTTLPTA